MAAGTITIGADEDGCNDAERRRSPSSQPSGSTVTTWPVGPARCAAQNVKRPRFAPISHATHPGRTNSRIIAYSGGSLSSMDRNRYFRPHDGETYIGFPPNAAGSLRRNHTGRVSRSTVCLSACSASTPHSLLRHRRAGNPSTRLERFARNPDRDRGWRLSNELRADDFDPPRRPGRVEGSLEPDERGHLARGHPRVEVLRRATGDLREDLEPEAEARLDDVVHCGLLELADSD